MLVGTFILPPMPTDPKLRIMRSSIALRLAASITRTVGVADWTVTQRLTDTRLPRLSSVGVLALAERRVADRAELPEVVFERADLPQVTSSGAVSKCSVLRNL